MPTAIWVDRQHAKLFRLNQTKDAPQNIQAHLHDHHTHRLNDDEKESKKFYEECAHALRETEHILIVGPGVAKFHFQTYLREHHPAVFKKVIGCETIHHSTDPQIFDFSKQFFTSKRPFF